MSHYKYSDFIFLEHDELLKANKDYVLVGKNVKNKEVGDNTSFNVIEFDGTNYPKTIFSNENKEKAENYFDLMINNHKERHLKLIYREDPIGFPNNQSIVAFSPDEPVSKIGNIVYYEYNENKDLVERKESLVDFAKSTNKEIENTMKLRLLENKIKEIYPNSYSGSNLRIDKIIEKKSIVNNEEIKNKILEIIKKENQKVIMLVGLPSTGKTTYIENELGGIDKNFILSNDSVREKIAFKHGFTYDDTFARVPEDLLVGDYLDGKESYGPIIEVISPYDKETKIKAFERIWETNKDIASVFEKGKEMANYVYNNNLQNIVIDMTNMSINDRERILKDIGIEKKDVEIINFMPNANIEEFCKDVKALANLRAIELQKEGIYKTIPEEAFDRMLSIYQKPDYSEGFKLITQIDNSILLKEIIKEKSNKEIEDLNFV